MTRARAHMWRAQHIQTGQPNGLLQALNGASAEVMARVLAANPSAASSVDKLSQLPLHLAAWAERNRRVRPPIVAAIQALVDAHPSAAIARDKRGCTPLHTAAESGAKAEAIAVLSAADRSAAGVRNARDQLPLHRVAVWGDAAAAAALLAAWPAAATAADSEGKLPLHYAALKAAPAETLQILLVANGAAAAARDQGGKLPLHYLVMHGGRAEPAAFAALLAANAAAAAAVDNEGRLPLHYAVLGDAPEETLLLFTGTCGAGAITGVRVFGRLGDFVTHEGAVGPPVVVAALLAANAAAAATADNMGRLPLHIAALADAKVETLQLLLDANGAAAGAQDRDGRLPLHHLAIHCDEAGPSAVAALLAENAAAAAAADASGRSPLHLALASASRLEVELALLDASSAAEAATYAVQPLPYDLIPLADRFCFKVEWFSCVPTRSRATQIATLPGIGDVCLHVGKAGKHLQLHIEVTAFEKQLIENAMSISFELTVKSNPGSSEPSVNRGACPCRPNENAKPELTL